MRMERNNEVRQWGRRLGCTSVAHSLRVLVVLVVSALLLAACGDSAEESAETVEGGFEAPLGGEAEERAKEAGQEMGSALGEADLPEKTIGIIHLSAASPASAELGKATEQAANVLGWDAIECDGQGDNAQIRRCMDTLLTQGVDGIANIAVEPSVVREALERAQQEDIPVVLNGAVVPEDPLIDGQYAPDDAGMAEVLAEWIVSELDGQGNIWMNNFEAGMWSELRTDRGREIFESTPGIEIVGEHSIDYANFEEDIRRTVEAALTAQQIDAIWGAVDFTPQPTAQAVDNQGVDHDDVIIVGFYGSDLNLQLLREGKLDAVATSALNASGWIVIDQMAQYFARGREFEQGGFIGAEPESYPLQILEPEVVTKETVPDSGKILPPVDYVSFFTAKWTAEFDL